VLTVDFEPGTIDDWTVSTSATNQTTRSWLNWSTATKPRSWPCSAVVTNS